MRSHVRKERDLYLRYLSRRCRTRHLARYTQPVYCGLRRNVDRGDQVGWPIEPAPHAPEVVACRSICLRHVRAARARSRGVLGVHKDQRDTVGLCLVRDELPKLPERPAHQRGSVRPSNGYPPRDPAQVFERDGARLLARTVRGGALGCSHDTVGDAMVLDGAEAGLLARDASQRAARAAGSSRLQVAPEVVVLAANLLDLFARVGVVVAVDREVIDAQVNAKDVVGVEGRLIVDLDAHVEVELALLDPQVGFTQPVLVREQGSLGLGDVVGELDALAIGPCHTGLLFVGQERVEASIVGEGAISLEGAADQDCGGRLGRQRFPLLGSSGAGFLVASDGREVALLEERLLGLVGVGDLGDDADGLLRLEVEASAQVEVEALLERSLAEEFEVEGLLGEPVAGRVEPSKEFSEGSLLGGFDAQLDGHDKDHVGEEKVEMDTLVRNEKRGQKCGDSPGPRGPLPSRPEGRGFRGSLKDGRVAW